ncbi:carbohydrate ABC transporter permease [Pseudaminobacter arsenicus]|uniref:Maltose/maltodextrin transport system permease protein MalG n=2 Tax=Borborobacter arsenicus TaxID=1851146 RepID=A0A432VCJ4_9HYPH|nr:carbohydrate ABC transporter permease [Pseudaminobacter arsenicus]
MVGWLLQTVAIIAVLGFFVLPIVYLVAVSFKTQSEVATSIFFPSEPTLANWYAILGTFPIFGFLGNSAFAAIVSSLGTLLIAVPAVYAISRYNMGGNALPSLTLGIYMAPPIVSLLPLFFLLRATGILHTLGGLTFVYALMNVPVALWLLQGFMHRIPREIDQAAAMDGAGPIRTLVAVILPTMMPGIVATGIICAVLSYNEFLFAFFMTASETRTMPIALALFQGDQIVNFGQMAVASLIGILPIAIAILFFQRWLIGGLTAGAEK